MKQRRKLFRDAEGDPKMGLIIILLAIISVITLFVATGIGPVSVDPEMTARILLHKLPWFQDRITADWTLVTENIVVGLRLPRVCLGMVVGASLAVCGVTMQALVRNNLADPFILGVSSGAAAFATLGMLFGTFAFLGTYSLSISAFIGAAVTIIFVYTLSRVRGRINITQLLLSGVAISMIMSGVTSIIKLGAPNALGLHNAEFWMSGSLAGAKWGYLKLPLVVLVLCLIFLLVNYRGLNLLLLGEENAGALGINVRSLQKQLVQNGSIVSGGFVGLMVPHFTRLLVGGDHRKVLPISALLGGILVVWVDVAARLIIAPEELPVGILTAIIGGPIFIAMLKKTTKENG